MRRRTLVSLIPGSLLLPAASWAAKPGKNYLVFVGTYTRGKSEGIYSYRFSAATGQLTPLGVAAKSVNPSFVTIHPNGRFLYSVTESTVPGTKSGSVTAFTIDRATGKLTALNTVESHGTSPCHLNVDKTGKNLLVVNYGSGSSVVFPVNNDGGLKEASSVIQHKGSGADRRRQAGPHAHSVNLSADNKFAMVADLGLDQVLVYRFDPTGSKISPNDPPFTQVPAGGGPRHFAFHPSQKFAYVINEMKSTVTAFTYDAPKGALTVIQNISTLPADFTGVNNTAEVQVHPNGKFVYGSNRGHNSIAVFKVDTKKGTLTEVDRTLTQGKTPRNFGIDPTGNFMIAANQDSDSLVVFRIDTGTGRLTPTGQTLEVGAPVCVKFLALP
ncbi:MAG: lactonase family protein [Acidobacteriia bacterium]|nr:lactonase family protein [Terriglobia bacterium]